MRLTSRNVLGVIIICSCWSLSGYFIWKASSSFAYNKSEDASIFRWFPSPSRVTEIIDEGLSGMDIMGNAAVAGREINWTKDSLYQEVGDSNMGLTFSFDVKHEGVTSTIFTVRPKQLLFSKGVLSCSDDDNDGVIDRRFIRVSNLSVYMNSYYLNVENTSYPVVAWEYVSVVNGDVLPLYGFISVENIPARSGDYRLVLATCERDGSGSIYIYDNSWKCEKKLTSSELTDIVKRANVLDRGVAGKFITLDDMLGCSIFHPSYIYDIPQGPNP